LVRPAVNMASNDRIILDEVLKQRKSEVDPSASASSYFELFTAEQVLKDFDLSYDEIDSGIVGDGGDGGIDAIYLFVNGALAQEEPEYTHLKKNIKIELVIIQAKTNSGFQETPIERFITVSDDIFDLSKEVESLVGVYNEGILEAIDRFRTVHQQLAAKFPSLKVEFYYACKGDKPGSGVTRKVEKLKQVINRHFPSAEFAFRFLGASELLTLARRVPQTTYTLVLAENPVSSDGQVGFVCLVRIRDFFAFISDEHAALHRPIFEANVRDYQGRTEVNDEIQQSLQANHTEDFWWLNNGVTIIASKASQSGKTLTVEDPQIVNGLQTSTEIFNYCKKYNTDTDNRKVLVRVIVPTQQESRDRIIKATNSQTAVQQASLRATDKIHRDIEEFIRSRGLYYDRRKNFYKNEGKPRDNIVSIPHLAQAVMAILLQRPDTARARPSSLLKKDEDYKKIYSGTYPIGLYYVCGEVIRRVEGYLKSHESGLTKKDRNNLRFYVAMHVVAEAANEPMLSAEELAQFDVGKVQEQLIEASLQAVKGEYDALGATDQIAKGRSLLELLKARLGKLGQGMDLAKAS
jgi:hypothetical protein